MTKQMETTELVVVHHGREIGEVRSRRRAAVCCNGWLAGARHGTLEGYACSLAWWFDVS
jgi:hypothetical protein